MRILGALSATVSASLALCSILCCDSIAEQQKALVIPGDRYFISPVDDIRFAFDFRAATDLLQAFKGAKYMGEYTINGGWCSSPDINIEIERLSVVGRTTYDLRQLDQTSSILAALGIHAREDDCRLGNFYGGCSGSIPLVGPPSSKATVPVKCRLNWDGTFIPVSADYKQDMDLAFPISIPPFYTFRLLSRRNDGSLRTSFSFARYDGTAWIAEHPPADKEKSVSVLGGAVFHNTLWNPITDPTHYVVDGRFMSIGFMRSGYTLSTNPDHALSGYFGEMSPFLSDPYAFATLRINESAIGATNSDQSGRGILGALFPLVIEGTYTTSELPTPITLRSVLAKPTATVRGAADGTPLISMSFSLEEVSLRAGDDVLPILTSPIVPVVTLAGPVVDTSGQLKFTAARVEVSLRTERNGRTIDIPIGEPIRDAINQGLPNLAKLSPKLVIDTPECIPAGERWNAWNRCRSIGDVVRDYVSRETPYKKYEINIIGAKTRIKGYNGYLVVTFVAERP